MFASHTQDYITPYFLYISITNIIGRPTYSTLTNLKKERKANTGSVTSDLGGGAHGHLGTVLSSEAYSNQLETPYNKPTHTGPLQIPSATSHHEAVRLRDEHNDKMVVFREALNIEKLSNAQLQQAIEKKIL